MHSGTRIAIAVTTAVLLVVAWITLTADLTPSSSPLPSASILVATAANPDTIALSPPSDSPWRECLVTTPSSNPSNEFAQQLKHRNRVWRNVTSKPWQSLVNNKLTGYLFADALGVPRPEVFACPKRPEDIPQDLDTLASVVVKPLPGANSVGVFLLRSGMDLLTGKSTTRADVVKSLVKLGPKKVQSIMVEELLVPEDLSLQAPPDLKFHMMGSRVAFIQFIHRGSRHHADQCHSFFDEHWNHIDRDIRINLARSQCETPPPAPAQLETLVALVRRMGAALGMYMRIDMFVTPRGPVLGEFTPWPDLGAKSSMWSAYSDCITSRMWTGDEGGVAGPLPEPPRVFSSLLDTLVHKQHEPLCDALTQTATTTFHRGRWSGTSFLQNQASAAGALRARLTNKRVFMLGDSLLRYQYLSLVTAVDSGFFPTDIIEDDHVSILQKDTYGGFSKYFPQSTAAFNGRMCCDCGRESASAFREMRLFHNPRLNATIVFANFRKAIDFDPSFPVLSTRCLKDPVLVQGLPAPDAQSHLRNTSSMATFLHAVRAAPSFEHFDHVVVSEGIWRPTEFISDPKAVASVLQAAEELVVRPRQPGGLIWATTPRVRCDPELDVKKGLGYVEALARNWRVLDRWGITDAWMQGQAKDDACRGGPEFERFFSDKKGQHFQPFVYRAFNEQLLNLLRPETSNEL